ncbi:hydantoinase B/oxoprolinase family protein [Agrobacterium salinitolerans]|uniref:Hydantoinase B/oxoprolinase family protein n=1 Tax=Agrobacterium salinitolerans TaxID=1183413 RepID=A0A9X3KTI1_9HYPH|nr:hydantoinase B/oxoprolinase family protein [Agrobacterium salinitolerans]MCZ7940680.1 hydantoinase B/oxoprolinase family protein [Agrobacterium salinitolerans]
MTAAHTSNRQALNPLVIAIVRHKLKAVTEEMVETMTRTCFSPILNQNQDFSAVILDAGFYTVSQAERVPIHMGAMPLAVEKMAEAFAGDLAEGDVLMANDPYWGGSHLPDITLAMPFFLEGRIWFWVALRAHQGDIGGMTAGGYAAEAREIWQEGLRIPPVKAVSRGALRTDVLRMVSENSRRPSDLNGDMMAQLAAVEVGVRRLSELFERYAASDIDGAVDAILNSGEGNMRALLRTCPDGIYRGLSHMEYDRVEGGLLPIPVTVTVTDGHAVVDLTEAPDQVEAFINSPLANTRAAVMVAFLYFSGEDEGLNDGSARAVEIITRKGSLLEPVVPAPVGACTSSTACAVIEAVLQALSPADPARAIGGFARRFRFAVSGHGRDGRPFIWHYFFNKGGTGGNLGHDGWSNIGGLHNPGGTPSPSIERTEASYPFVVEEYCLVPDTGGAGTSRGGLGGRLVLRYEGTEHAIVNASGEGVDVVPYGAASGKDARGHDYRIKTTSGAERVIGVHDSALPLEKGGRIVCLSAGGGGYGDPKSRNPDDVSRDVVFGYVSEKAAKTIYGCDLR